MLLKDNIKLSQPPEGSSFWAVVEQKDWKTKEITIYSWRFLKPDMFWKTTNIGSTISSEKNSKNIVKWIGARIKNFWLKIYNMWWNLIKRMRLVFALHLKSFYSLFNRYKVWQAHSPMLYRYYNIFLRKDELRFNEVKLHSLTLFFPDDWNDLLRRCKKVCKILKIPKN